MEPTKGQFAEFVLSFVVTLYNICKPYHLSLFVSYMLAIVQQTDDYTFLVGRD